jgi:hypothetical protein
VQDPSVAQIVIDVGEECLRTIDQLISTTKASSLSKSRFAVCVAMAYYLGKIRRVTRAALTLIAAGQGLEALALVREQNHFVFALNYYHFNPAEAELFTVSQTLLKRDFARKIMSFDDRAASDPKRLAQLKALEKDVVDAYRLFPGLKRPKGKSGTTKSPILTDWSEPSYSVMHRNVLDILLRKRYADDGEQVDEAEYSQKLDKLVERTYFFGNTYMSQSKHGTSLDIDTVLNIDDRGVLSLIAHQIEDPNRLGYHFIQNAMPPMLIYRDDIIPMQCETELVALGESQLRLRLALNIEDQQPII